MILNFVITFLSFQMSTLLKQIFDNVLLHIHISRAHNDKLNLFNAETVHNYMVSE